ncbi:endosomal/lysosomal proton channel TMEM175 [Hydra vulgaris]|uniref:endosomal/lysosomal proton channel TMEM175 n=1 Tax=Hydra vulgaris TaxID=6087 RepID=UPI001F5EE6B6|nr:endosomal/lysosomal potassium channel TMEM175 [Hydra vulgaris]
MSLETVENVNGSSKNIRKRSTWKDTEENYEEYLNKTMPEDHHRGDIASTARLLSYSDTVMATCATFLVLPIRNLKKNSGNQSLSEFFNSSYLQFIEFLFGFLIILTVWENMNIRAIVIKRVDDLILALIIFEMLVTSTLPFTVELQGHYPNEKISVLSTCIVLTILQIIDIVIILYGTFSPKLLHLELKCWTKSDLRELASIMLFKPLISLILLAIAAAFCLVHYGVSWAVIALLILMPTIRKFYWFVCRKYKNNDATEKGFFLENFSKGNVPKERVENMSDNAIAIMACILVADITVDEFPKKFSVEKDGLNYNLKVMTPEFLTFLASFCLVSALWYVNHSVLHLIKNVNSVMLYFQKVFLMFCCLCPLAGNTVLHFATKGNKDSVVAIRFSATVVFISSIANFFIFLCGVFTGTKYFYDWASLKHFQKNKRQHYYAVAKAVNLPFWSLICILGSLGSASAAPYVLYVSFLAAPCSFFVSKLVLMNHFGKAAAYIRNTIRRKVSFPNKRKEDDSIATKKISESLETIYPDSYVIKNENMN